MTPPSTGNNAIIIRLEEKLDKLMCLFNDFKLGYTEAHGEVVHKAETALEKVFSLAKVVDEKHTKLEERMCRMEGDLDKLKDSVKPLVFQAKILGWLGAILGVSIIGLIWGILTHTITIVVP